MFATETNELQRDRAEALVEAGSSFACRARLRVALRRSGAASFAWLSLAWFTEPKLAEGERRMVDQTGIEPVTS